MSVNQGPLIKVVIKRCSSIPYYLQNYNNMNEKKYNGWTNYATWRVNLEILGDITFPEDGYKIESEEEVSVDYLKDIVEECVFTNFNTCDTPRLVEDYARAFIDEVNFYEIANHITYLKQHKINENE